MGQCRRSAESGVGSVEDGVGAVRAVGAVGAEEGVALGAERLGEARVKYRMLHIPGILDCTYHLHVSCLCAQGSSIAEYLDYSP